MMNIFWILFSFFLLCLSACSSTDVEQELECTAEQRPAIRVSAFDNLSSEAIDSFLVVVRDGSFVDSAYSIIPGLQATFPPFAMLAYERVGVYTVTVESAGYEDWERNNIDVGETEFGCHVETEEIEAGLDPVSEG